MLFTKEDIITCWGWRNLCDYIYEQATNLESLPEGGQVCWSPMNHIQDLFKRINGSRRDIILVSSFCDYNICLQEQNPVWKDLEIYLKLLIEQHGKEIGYQGVNLQPRYNPQTCKQEDLFSIKTFGFTHATTNCIPREIKKWFVVNCALPLNYDNRIIHIPFGVQRDSENRWCNQYSDWESREIMYYLNWTDWTPERRQLKEVLSKLPIYDRTIITKEISHDSFKDDLLQHRFVICPQGIGIDTYRVLETIYTGGYALVKNNSTNQGLGLPVIFYNNINDILDTEYLVDSVKSIQEASKQYDVYEKAKLTYWKNRIEEERKLLLGGFYNDDNV